jgi:hypothetical protein
MPSSLRHPDEVALRIFQLYHSEIPVLEISKRLGIGRNAIQAHLRGEYEYTPKIQDKINALMSDRPGRVKPTPGGYLSMREARLVLPFHPSEQTAYALARKKAFKTELVKNRRLTTAEWVNDYVRREYGEMPMGVCILSRDLDLILLDEIPRGKESLFERVTLGRAANYATAHMLWSVRDACDTLGLRFQIPKKAYFNALASLRVGASFVLLSRRMFHHSAAAHSVAC